MTQSESYDLQTQRMAASQHNDGKIFGRFDPIHIALAVTTVIFLILSIVFIILFATKHDSSTGFLTTGFSNNKSDEIANDLKGRLKKKYTVNSFALDLQNEFVSAVFSLRDSVSPDDVQKVLVGSTTVTQLQTTYGDKASSVCHQTPLVTQPPTSTASTPTSAVTVTTAAPSPSSSEKPPSAAKYCESNPVTRDIIVYIDMNTYNAKNNQTEKTASLKTISSKLATGLIFPQANVFLKAVVGDAIQDVSTDWADSSAKLSADFDKLFAIPNLPEKKSFSIASVLKNGVEAFRKGRAFVPGAIFVLTDKPNAQDAVTVKARDFGIFVGVAGVRSGYLNQFTTFADLIDSYDTWTLLASADPFQKLVCSFYSLPPAALSGRFTSSLLQLDAATDTTKCQVLDIILAFDTSESLSRIILPKYVEFAKKLVAQYKYGNDFTRVGVFTFNSEVNEVLTLTHGNNIDAVNAAINSVQYTGGLTDVTKALNTANTYFTSESSASRSKVLIVMSDAVPTVDTYQQEIAAGKQLAKNGVDTFFIGYSSYSPDVIDELGKVTNPNFVFGDMSDATFAGVTQQILIAYPCPVPKCVTAFYAIEISEATDDYVVQNLKDILTISTNAALKQSGTESYQLVTYSEDKTQFFPKGDSSLKSFQAFVQSLIDDQTKIVDLRGGNTRLDTAINDITAELASQAAKNNRFSGNILFFGQANDAVLDPKDTDQRRALLANAATQLKGQIAGLIFVVDDSRPVELFGDDLWSMVTAQNRIIQKSDNIEAALEATDYFTTWAKLSCSLPPLATCWDTQLDVAVIIDLQNKDYVFMNYITSLLAQFSAQDDAHFSMFAYGSQKTTILSNLAAHSAQDIQDYATVFEEWRNGSYFTTTVAQTSTTPIPSSSTIKPADFWSDNLYQVDKGMISGVFDSVSTQFGCGHYSDDGDRIFAPNLFIFASDNFGTYTDAVWADFQTELHNRYGCWDCAGTPNFLFLSRTEATAPASIGPTITLSTTDMDIDATDDTSTQSNINKFNSIVNYLCTAPLPQCASYTCFA